MESSSRAVVMQLGQDSPSQGTALSSQTKIFKDLK